jgi:hypothetical protein
MSLSLFLEVVNVNINIKKINTFHLPMSAPHLSLSIYFPLKVKHHMLKDELSQSNDL